MEKIRNARAMLDYAADYAAMIENALAAIELYKEGIVLHSAGVVDFLGDNVAKFEEYQRAAKMSQFLQTFSPPVDLVLIERQPAHLARWGGAAAGSSAIAEWLLYHYSTKHVCKFISPKEKNKVAMTPALIFGGGEGTEAQRKAARKRHSTDNFAWILRTFPNDINIPAPLLNHAADACMQAIAFCADARRSALR